MQLFVGTVAFPVNGVRVALEQELVRDENRRPHARIVRMTAQGEFLAETANHQIELAQKQGILSASLGQGQYVDVRFLTDSGAVAAQLLNAGSTSGVQVVKGPDFPFTPLEYATQRSFSFVCEAEYPLRLGEPIVIGFSETVTFWGGGPRRVMVEAVDDLPQPQTLVLATAFMATQQGRAEMNGTWPPVQPPLFPGAFLEAPRITYGSPQRRGRGLSNFSTAWAYLFGSPLPLGQGRPAIPPE